MACDGGGGGWGGVQGNKAGRRRRAGSGVLIFIMKLGVLQGIREGMAVDTCFKEHSRLCHSDEIHENEDWRAVWLRGHLERQLGEKADGRMAS